MSKRDDIITTSLKMFNNSNIKAITTNHISQECDISPGNLYYHFKNKEEIIREHFKNLAEKQQELRMKYVNISHISEMVEFYRAFFKLAWEYRFLFRERFSLCDADPLLQKDFKVFMQGQMNGVSQTIYSFLDRKIIPPMSAEEVQNTTEVICMFFNNWPNYFNVDGEEFEERDLKHVIDLIFFVARRRDIEWNPPGEGRS